MDNKIERSLKERSLKDRTCESIHNDRTCEFTHIEVLDERVKEAYRTAFEELWNNQADSKFHGEFDPTKEDEDFMQGIMYVMNTMLVKGNELEIWQERLPKFTLNMLKSFGKHGVMPKATLEDNEKSILISKLRQTNDATLMALADDIESHKAIIKTSDIEHLNLK